MKESNRTSGQSNTYGHEAFPFALHPALDALPTLIFVKDRQLRLVSANQAVFDALGLDRSCVLGKTATEVLGNTNVCEQMDSEVVATGEPRFGILEPLELNGVTRWFLTDKCPIVSPSGEVIGLVGTLTDVSEQVRTQEALGESERQFRTLGENAPDVVNRIDRSMRFVYVNPAAEQLIGLKADTCIGKTARELGLPPAYCDLWEPIFGEVIASGRPHRQQFTFNARDGEHVFDCRSIPEFGEDGEVVSILNILRDINELHKARDELERSESTMRELATYLQGTREREQTDLARDLHDQVGQGLTAIRLDLDLLRRQLGERTEISARDRLDRITSAIDGLSRDVRTLSTELRPGMLDDLGLCAAIEWQASQFADRTGIQVELHLDCGTEPLPPGHATALFRALQDVLRNVARHSGSPTVQICLEQRESQVVLTVTDRGRGITEAEIHSPHSLGLLGLYERIRLLSGSVEISGGDGGTTVVIALPLNECA